MASVFENAAQFQKDMQEVLNALQNKGVKEAAPLAKTFKEKYFKEAKISRGSECSGCASCSGCAICGPSTIEAIQVGHLLQAVHLN